MPIRRWLRSFSEPARLSVPADALFRDALDGTSLDRLIPMAARCLLRAAHADRAGVWLSPESGGAWTGAVVDAQRPAPRPEWQRLDFGSALLDRLLGQNPVVIDLREEPKMAADFLKPMRTALGFLLVAEGRPFGAVVMGYAVTRARQQLHILRSVVEEVALALAYARERERSQASGPPQRARRGQTEKLAALGQIVSGIAHELNNPLTSIMGYAQLLLSRSSDPSQEANTRLLYQEAERARRIVQNLLVFARESKSERRSIDLNEIVERTVALRSYELRVENTFLEMDLANELPPVSGDAHQLQQVVLNLIVNAEQAILHSRPDDPELRPLGKIKIRTGRRENGRLFLEVTDNGPGIQPAIAGRIFDPFFTTKPIGQGTGLGLSIAYGIIQEHRGEIYVARSSGRDSGGRLVVELPALESAVPRRSAIGAVRPSAKRTKQAPFVGAQILVVEDEPTVAHLVADVLAEEGHQVEFVLDSREGLHRALHHSFDLIICDLRMPQFDGRAFYEALVRENSPAQRRLVFITGDTLGARTLEFLDAHALPYLGKPFLVEELKAVVNQALQPALSAPGKANDAAGEHAPPVQASRTPGRNK